MNDPLRPWWNDASESTPLSPQAEAEAEADRGLVRETDSQPEDRPALDAEHAEPWQPGAEQPGAEQPDTEHSGTGQAGTGQAGTGQTVAEPRTGEPIADEPSAGGRAGPWDDEFGVLDIVESFTAMRHEWKTQTRETRLLAEAVGRAVERIEAASRPNSSATATVDPDARARHLAELIAEIDFTVDRAVTASSHFGQARTEKASVRDSELEELQERFSQLGWLRRWMASAWHAQVRDWLEERADRAAPTDSLLQGLALMRQRVQRLMQDAGIERLDVVGRPFDANVMNAIEAVERPDVPAGQVLEQMRPAYFWKNKLIKYADVRIAR